MWLIWSIIAASVVLLPLPVVPVSRMRPRSSSAMVFTIGGSSSAAIELTPIGMTRRAMAIVPR